MQGPMSLGPFLLSIPFLGMIWEYRRWGYRMDRRKEEEDFQGDTPFYGSRWGYATDYMVEQSLQTGDVIFFQDELRALHLYEAIPKLVSNFMSGSSEDQMGVILVKEGRRFIVELGRGGERGVKVTPYPERLAHGFSQIVSGRRLVCHDADRARLRRTLLEMIEETPSRVGWIATMRAHFRRQQVKRTTKDFYKLREAVRIGVEMIGEKETLRILGSEMLGALTHADRDAESPFFGHLSDPLGDQRERPRAARQDEDERGRRKPSYVQRRARTILMLLEEHEGRLDSLEEERAALLNDRQMRAGQRRIDKTSASGESGKSKIPRRLPVAAFTALLYQKAGFLPPFPFYDSYTPEDFKRLTSLIPACGVPMPDVSGSGGSGGAKGGRAKSEKGKETMGALVGKAGPLFPMLNPLVILQQLGVHEWMHARKAWYNDPTIQAGPKK
uniref:Uncharacterized protein n=1 Tax=Chromera velia CCMP2878 TaxID=1169474 RepID=A0A0G4G6U4_9ALVE|eukprot:Cvel_4263.t1-p1 / transcript=Cvel_4263.t1 / gene=Cvel_4263 / organism=Chromera_velia_CCMP2878 / gene_product=hypothetical protein / transcript_product=hypothetical protein / location=Cvel_scaffold184:105574-113719(-) / protein_length=442 / sequence_SO=supercontig / SO=protein_coding / is_pseudo=false